MHKLACNEKKKLQMKILENQNMQVIHHEVWMQQKVQVTPIIPTDTRAKKKVLFSLQVNSKQECSPVQQEVQRFKLKNIQ